MKEYSSEFIRNVALVSHSGSGKTMLAEAFLHVTGATTRLGRVEDGTTIADFEDEEVRRQISLSTSILPVEYKDHKINVLDTPGYTDFVGEVISALRVADAALVLVDAVAGAEVGTEIAMQYADTFKLPRFVVINKMNRDNANFQKALQEVDALSDSRLLPVQLPWGEKADFKGVIDLFKMKAIGADGAVDIPAEFADAADEARMALIEAAAEGEDALLEKYLEGQDLSEAEVARGFRNVVQTGDFIPVFVTAATAELGITSLLDGILSLVPSPLGMAPVVAVGKKGDETLSPVASGPLAAYVWKTTADPFVGKITYFRVYSGVLTSDSRVWNSDKNVEERFGTVSLLRGKEQINVKTVHVGDIATVPKLNHTITGDTLCDKDHPLVLPQPEYPNALYQIAIFPRTQADAAKISSTLTRLCEEDSTLSWRQEMVTGQTILQGMGDQHLDAALRKAEHKFQTALNFEIPKVPYQETILKEGSAQHRHKKQTGGAGQFAEVHLRVMPNEEEEYTFSNDVVGGAISSNFMTSIDKGIKAVLKEGVIAGYPVLNVKVSVFDGKEHPVDSKPVAFETAGREAFKLAFKEASPVLREPIMNVRVIVPETSMGDIIGDLNTRRARVSGMDSEKGRSVVTASVPLAEMQRYTTDLRSMTGGRGVFSMEFSHYEMVPHQIAQEVVAARQKELHEED